MAKIMIVDDEEDIRDAVRSILESKRYKVSEAKDGDECLRLVKKEKPDLILMDILMPGASVNDVLPKLNNFKVIIFSVVTLREKYVAETGKLDPRKLKFPNVVDSINKPVDLDELLAKVKKALS
jgi:CheY-like chemotaxis protein